MFNLLVKASGWAEGRDSIPSERLFEHTSEALASRFRVKGEVDFGRLLELPAVFLEESGDNASTQVVRVGSIIRIRPSAGDLKLDFVYDPSVRPFTNDDLEAASTELGIDNWEFHRTHWAVKEADLFRALLRQATPPRRKARVFVLAEPEKVEPRLVSVMMPFDSSFDEIYAVLRDATGQVDLKCRRADDIWENPAVIQDVVSLIDRSRVVICDCTGRNPNVFYETGIAHALGREVVIITQSEADVPFDLRHLRFIRYSTDSRGRNELKKRVSARLSDIIGTKEPEIAA